MFDADEMYNVMRYTSEYRELRRQVCMWYMEKYNKPCHPDSDFPERLIIDNAKSVYYNASKENQEKWDANSKLLLDYMQSNRFSLFPYKEKESSQTGGGCYVATCVYGSYDCPEVWTLRRYRDHTLGSTWYGRAFIRTYYAISPTLVKWFGDSAWFKKLWKTPLDSIVKKLASKGVENTPYEDQEW